MLAAAYDLLRMTKLQTAGGMMNVRLDAGYEFFWIDFLDVVISKSGMPDGPCVENFCRVLMG